MPHDILRISGEEAVQQYLTREIQNVYRSQRVEINDKHIEIIVAQMLRKVRVETVGDTELLPGSVMDKFEFRADNQELAKCLKITDKGDSDFEEGAIVPIDSLEQANAQIEALGGDAGQGRQAASRPPPARSCWASPRPPCKARASSRPPASRKPPRCSPKRPWPARSTTWSG